MFETPTHTQHQALQVGVGRVSCAAVGQTSRRLRRALRRCTAASYASVECCRCCSSWYSRHQLRGVLGGGSVEHIVVPSSPRIGLETNLGPVRGSIDLTSA